MARRNAANPFSEIRDIPLAERSTRGFSPIDGLNISRQGERNLLANLKRNNPYLGEARTLKQAAVLEAQRSVDLDGVREYFVDPQGGKVGEDWEEEVEVPIARVGNQWLVATNKANVYRYGVEDYEQSIKSEWNVEARDISQLPPRFRNLG